MGLTHFDDFPQTQLIIIRRKAVGTARVSRSNQDKLSLEYANHLDEEFSIDTAKVRNIEFVFITVVAGGKKFDHLSDVFAITGLSHFGKVHQSRHCTTTLVDNYFGVDRHRFALLIVQLSLSQIIRSGALCV